MRERAREGVRSEGTVVESLEWLGEGGMEAECRNGDGDRGGGRGWRWVGVVRRASVVCGKVCVWLSGDK